MKLWLIENFLASRFNISEELGDLRREIENFNISVEKHLFSVLRKYEKPWKKIDKDSLKKFENLFYKEYLKERNYWIVKKWVVFYEVFKPLWEEIFIDQLGDILWENRAKKLLMIWWVESYFGMKDNNRHAKWFFQFTKDTGKLYWLVWFWRDLRKDPVFSAKAAAMLIRNNIFSVLVKTWKVNKDFLKYIDKIWVYEIKKWDTIKEIAQRYNLNPEFLLKINLLMNNKLNPKLLKQGQKVYIPVSFKKSIKDYILEDDIFLALEMYNGWIINRFKKFPKSIVEYDTILKDLYLEYRYVLKVRCRRNVICLRKRLRFVERKYFKWWYSLVFKSSWELISNNSNKLLKHIEFIIFQQFKYPWKYYWAIKFLDRYEKLILKDKPKLVDFKDLWEYIKFAFSKWEYIRIWKIKVKYNWESFEDFISKIEKHISTVKKEKLIIKGYYTVRRWDTLFSIWKRYVKKSRISLYKFMKINWIDNARYLKVGQKLKIPSYKIVNISLYSRCQIENIVLRKIKENLKRRWRLYEYRFGIKQNWENKVLIYLVILSNNENRK